MTRICGVEFTAFLTCVFCAVTFRAVIVWRLAAFSLRACPTHYYLLLESEDLRTAAEGGARQGIGWHGGVAGGAKGGDL